MIPRCMGACVVLLSATGCQFDFADPASIAGQYALTRVDGGSLPRSLPADSSGTVVTILDGVLSLGEAAPEGYVETPAGIPMARSCVHEIPDGAGVSQDGLVTLPDGRTYQIPPCGDGDYTMVITRRCQYANGASQTLSDTTSARYTWGGSEPSGGGIISLLGGERASGLGQVATSQGGVELTIDMGVRVGPLAPLGPQYTFFRAIR